jgi:hypothetical protein
MYMECAVGCDCDTDCSTDCYNNAGSECNNCLLNTIGGCVISNCLGELQDCGNGGGGAGGAGNGGAGGGANGGSAGAGGTATCADLLACCNSLSGDEATACLTNYNSFLAGGDALCGPIVQLYQLGGDCL